MNAGRLHALRFLCIVTAAGFGIDYAGGKLADRAGESGLPSVFTLDDGGPCLWIGGDVAVKACLTIPGAAGRRFGLSAALYERRSGFSFLLF